MLVRNCSGPADSSELEKSMSDRQRESSAQPLEFQSATEMLSLLRAKRIGAVELLKLHLERFDKYNPALNVDGLPMGVQVIGPYMEDRTPLRFAQLVERELGGFKAPTLKG
jgi:Asp-tRNA(Asn)/Glu-tRNA(Gln) amidotransferase A subunit family amidase